MTWGPELPVHPAGALQSKVSRLRHALEAGESGGGALVMFRSSGYLLQVGHDALDEHRFAALVERAGAASDPRDQAGLLADALGLWRGPPLADFADALSETGRQILKLLRTVVQSEEITALVATHDGALLDLADSVLRLEDGQLATPAAPNARPS